jgi:hypothetical protein
LENWAFRDTGLHVTVPGFSRFSRCSVLAGGTAHENPRTTKLYDGTSDEIRLDEIERIGI